MRCESDADSDSEWSQGGGDSEKGAKQAPHLRGFAGLTGDNIGCKGLYGFDIDGDSVLAGVGR